MVRHYIEIHDKIIDPPFIILKHEVTEEEFFKFATEDISCELIDGVLVIHSPASLVHENIFQMLLTLLKLYLEKTKQGKVIGSRFVMRLDSQSIFEPDLMVILPSSLDRLKPTFLDGPAHFVIEILSPSTRETDLLRKIPRCLEKGVKEIWAIDPQNEELQIFIPGEKTKVYQGNEIVTSAVIKGFWINLEWIWKTGEFNSLYCYNEILSKQTFS
ncbi:MAG: Uma2 family endonuclease [Candidatus Helarchaeota archaeon]|nr:Uma2 family endonuclease [Candidatus Helarchaeota archaeon]